MNCPKCGAEFDSVTYEDIQIDRCSGCGGLWFDQLEKDDLEKLKGSEAVDIGDEAVGKEQNKLRDIKCPKCHDKMIKMVDKDQFHIQYEFCQSCGGTYFDAGEFRDLKELTVMERIKQMFDTVKTNLK